MRHPQIAARVFHTPLLAAPAKAAAFIMGLGPRLVGAEVSVAGAEPTPEASRRARASLLDARLEEEIGSGRRAAYRVRDGIAVLPVTGTLVHRGAWLGQSSGETSYEGLSAQLDMVGRDAMVRGVALEIDSFGGEVAGCFALADQVRALREEKPVWAFVSDHAYSAAYAIAAQASRIVLPRTAGAGSIGVICMHADYSGALEQMGVQVTVIAAGAHKADGNPYAALPEAVREGLAAEMEQLRGLFAETVGQGRGARLDAAAALATEARCLIGADAVAAGLADEIANPREAFEAFADEIHGRAPARQTSEARAPARPLTTAEGASSMSGPTPTTPAPQVTAPAATTPAPPAATPPAASPAAPEGTAPAPAPEASSEDPKKRIAAILTSPEAAGREDLARSFAFDSDMSSAEAIRHLASAPKTGAAAGLSASIDAEATELETPSAGEAGAPDITQRAAKRYGKA
ncbi:S49 family peptidase [Salipiger manganoxidans]|uniref:S49 family peptidase n=1 Tax=Salipiger marinus TaxID=555512 RepID=UPI001E4DB232|nr:S49 family peptidase [Salipiger manganoxidans]MCD1621167.1 S49 family peptidase [Salipiger manganoxidans]